MQRNNAELCCQKRSNIFKKDTLEKKRVPKSGKSKIFLHPID